MQQTLLVRRKAFWFAARTEGKTTNILRRLLRMLCRHTTNHIAVHTYELERVELIPRAQGAKQREAVETTKTSKQKFARLQHMYGKQDHYSQDS